ncbi:N-carbamoylputrescine amidase [Lachnospiraceae bacterium XBB1006]|nr:N-carbamoylputrescine amidase [Lachnospiraceae bacterium XBB1006]
MRVALAAVGFKNGDMDYNRNRMTELMQEYGGRAEMIVFGETFLQGFDSLSFSYEQDKTIGITLEDATIAEICKAAKANRIAVSFGFVEREGEALFSSQVTIGADGTILDRFRRVSDGWKIPEADEHYREGDGFHDFSYLGEKFAVGLCGDLWHDENVKQMKRLQADVVLWPVYTDFNYQEWNETIKQEYAEQAAGFGRKVLYVNSVCLERNGDEIARGGAAFFAEGKIKQEVPAGEEAVLLCEISL